MPFRVCKFRIKRYSIAICCILITLIVSCDQGICESFDFKKIPFKPAYYRKSLTYTNGSETVTLYPKVEEYSRESILNAMGNPDCNPFYSISYSSKQGDLLNLLYSFDSHPDEDFTNFSVFINTSYLNIKVDSNFMQKSNRNVKNTLESFDLPNSNDSSKMIKMAILEKMRLTEIETYTGVKWKLIKIGSDVSK